MLGWTFRKFKGKLIVKPSKEALKALKSTLFETVLGRGKQIWKNQHGCRYHCGLPMDISDKREILFKVPKAMGGKDEVRNMAYAHKHCQ